MTRNNLKKIRLKAGFTQKVVAALLRVDRNTYIALENGLIDMPFYMLKRVCGLFGVSPEDVLQESGGFLRENTVFEYPSLSEEDDGENDGEIGFLTTADEVRLAKMHLIDTLGKRAELDRLIDGLLTQTASDLLNDYGVFEENDEPDVLDQIDKKELEEYAALFGNDSAEGAFDDDEE